MSLSVVKFNELLFDLSLLLLNCLALGAIFGKFFSNSMDVDFVSKEIFELTRSI